jgi:hypothetical protein
LEGLARKRKSEHENAVTSMKECRGINGKRERERERV